MSQFKTIFTCQQCQFQSPQWLGKCPRCAAWNTMIEDLQRIKPKKQSKAQPLINLDEKNTKPVNLGDIQKTEYARIPTSLSEFDRVLGGGIVPGAVVLIGGEPGVGKSTILLQIAMILAEKTGQSIYYISAEESPQQIKMRADRINKKTNGVIIYPQSDIDQVIQYLQKESEKKQNLCVIIDSVQTVVTADIDTPQGTITQVREVATRLVRYAKQTNTPIIIIGHITKDGTLAGPKVLEHLVDTVIYLEGEKDHDIKIMRAVKNRFGASDEVGVFQMTEQGLQEVTNPSGIFLKERTVAPGSIACATLEGTRPVILEVQALVTQSLLAIPRRTATGYDINRLQMLLAVLTKKLNLQLFNQDVYLNIVGGIKINEPSADLAVCLAIISSLKNTPIPLNTIAFGEVGLQGEIRRVKRQEKRIEEAKKLGFEKFIYSEKMKNITSAYKYLQNTKENITI